jgi:hypothetical protein
MKVILKGCLSTREAALPNFSTENIRPVLTRRKVQRPSSRAGRRPCLRCERRRVGRRLSVKRLPPRRSEEVRAGLRPCRSVSGSASRVGEAVRVWSRERRGVLLRGSRSCSSSADAAGAGLRAPFATPADSTAGGSPRGVGPSSTGTSSASVFLRRTAGNGVPRPLVGAYAAPAGGSGSRSIRCSRSSANASRILARETGPTCGCLP